MTVNGTISPTQSDVQKALGNFLLTILPAGTEIIASQPNQVAEPKATSYVMMTPISFRRLSTNLDTYEDVVFVGSAAAAVLTVTESVHGLIVVPAEMFGPNVPAGTIITEQLTGAPGGTGTYAVSNTFALGSTSFASGSKIVQENAEIVVQLDFHSEDYSAAQMAQTVSALMRDEFGTSYFEGLDPPLNRISPLLADDPAKRPFVNDQAQFEWRWVLDARLQVNQIVTLAQQFAQQVDIGLIEVDSHYPP